MALDIGPYLAPIVTAIIAAGATYAAMLSRITRLETRIEAVERVNASVNSLTNQITALSVKLDELKSDVSKHNQLIERTFQLESETKAQWRRIDELRGELHEVKVGGSK